MKLYGWTEVGDCCSGINVIDVKDSYEDGDVFVFGEWFPTFKEAKAAQIKWWRQRRDIAIYALRDLRNQTEAVDANAEIELDN